VTARNGRVLLVAAVLAVVGVAAVVVLYDRGWLPIAGPFVALAVAPLLAWAGVAWMARRHDGLARRTGEALSGLLPELERERALGRDDRSSGATDETLDAAIRRARTALSQLSFGDDVSGAREVDALSAVARSWAGGSAAAEGVRRAADLTERLRASRRRLDRRRQRTTDARR